MSDAKALLTLRRKMQKRNHPARGSTIKVEPIRDVAAIEKIRNHLHDQPRDLCLFVLGINTAYRASELLSLRVSDVADLGVGDMLTLKQGKNAKYRNATINRPAYDAIRNWLAHHPNPVPSAPLFLSARGDALTVSTLSQYVKRWCQQIGLNGNYASHSLRKTWGYHHRINTKQPEGILPKLVRAYGHSSEAQTLEYLCIQPEEIRDLYLQQEL